MLNAVNEQLVWDLQKATENVMNDDSVKVVILTGAGRGFSAGADLSERKASWSGSKDALIRGYKPSFENIINMPKPVIASVPGPAAGIGAALAMSCDLRVMSEDSYLLSVFSNIALVPDGGLSWFLPKFMGYAKAYEHAIEAKKILASVKVDENVKVSEWDDKQTGKIREEVSKLKIEGELKAEIQTNIKRLMDIGCYRGIRHRSGLPLRGQHTKNNSRTRKGKRKTVANKKKATK